MLRCFFYASNRRGGAPPCLLPVNGMPTVIDTATALVWMRPGIEDQVSRISEEEKFDVDSTKRIHCGLWQRVQRPD